MTTPHLTVAMLLTILSPVLGKLVQWLLDLAKKSSAFANASDGVKQIVGFVVSLVLGWLTTHFGLVLTGTSLDTLTANDMTALIGGVLTAILPWVNSALAWLFAMIFHNSQKQAQLTASVAQTKAAMSNNPSAALRSPPSPRM